MFYWSDQHPYVVIAYWQLFLIVASIPSVYSGYACYFYGTPAQVLIGEEFVLNVTCNMNYDGVLNDLGYYPFMDIFLSGHTYNLEFIEATVAGQQKTPMVIVSFS